MDRHGQIRLHEPDQLQALLDIHGHHDERDLSGRDGRAAQVGQHEIDRLALVRVPVRDGAQLVHQERVARNVDSGGGGVFLVFHLGEKLLGWWWWANRQAGRHNEETTNR